MTSEELSDFLVRASVDDIRAFVVERIIENEDAPARVRRNARRFLDEGVNKFPERARLRALRCAAFGYAGQVGVKNL